MNILNLSTAAKACFRLLRPAQYAKNLFVFFPLFFTAKITEIDLLLRAIGAFVAFSLVASSIYILNDYRDRHDDRLHPVKKNRPLASGALPIPAAFALMIVTFACGLILGWYFSPLVMGLLGLYALNNIAYTAGLKHLAIIDVFLIATGFVLRIFTGGAATNTSLSVWIILMTFLLALFLALAKRRDDVMIFVESGNKMRKSIDGYNMQLLDSSMVVMASVITVSYIMYTLSPETISRMKTDKLYLTVFWVLLGIMRYMQITYVFKASGSPTEVLLKDRFLQLTITGWIVTFGILIYHAWSF